MDYKELIDILRMTASSYDCSCYECSQCISAVSAIETLLKERDALLSEIKGDCHSCAFETGACVACDDGSAWQWRGPRKDGEK